MADWQPKSRQSERWRWRVSHLVWGAFTLFMMGWAFLLGLLVGQGSLGTPEQVASLKGGLTSVVPGLGSLAPAEDQAPPAPASEERLQQPQLNFYDEVERSQAQAQAQAKTTAPTLGAAASATPPAQVSPTATPAATPFPLTAPAAPSPAAPQAAPAAQTPPAPPVRTGPPVLGKLEPFRPETAPPVDLAPPAAKPGQTHPPQPYQPARQAGTGQVASAAPRVAPSPAPAPRRGRLIVQVATFQDEYAARDLVNRLRASGHPAFLVRSELEGVGPRFRVRVGPYDDIDLAQGAAGRIRLQHNLASFVTREDQP